MRLSTTGDAAEPQRDRPLHRQRVDAGRVGRCGTCRVVDDFLRPELAQELDLLDHDLAPVGEVRPGASNSTSFQPAAITRRSRPPERMSTSAACLASSRAWRCGAIRIPVLISSVVVSAVEEAEEDERVVPRHVLVVQRRLAEVRLPVGAHAQVGAEHVVADGDVAVPELFDTAQELCDRAVISADQVLRQVGSELHHVASPGSWTRRTYRSPAPFSFGVTKRRSTTLSDAKTVVSRRRLRGLEVG